MKKITLTLTVMVCTLSLLFGQTIINDFEAGSPAVTTEFGATFQVIANPDTNGNSSANVGQLGRTSGNWFELIDFTSTSYTVTAGDTKYLHVYVWYPAEPDVSVRFNGGQNPDIRPTFISDSDNISFTPSQWQDIVFPLDNSAGTTDVTVTAIRFLGDLGFQNDPAGFVLDNTSAFGYIDNFRFNDDPNPETLSNDSYDLGNTLSLYPNPTSSKFNIMTSDATKIQGLKIFNSLGQLVASEKDTSGLKEFDMSNLDSGLYFVKLEDALERSVTQKLLKN